MRGQLLPVAQFDFHGLEVHVVRDGPIRLLDADAERHCLAAHIAIVQYAEWSLLTHERVPNDISFEEELAGRRGADLGVRSTRETDERGGQCEGGEDGRFHWVFPRKIKQ